MEHIIKYFPTLSEKQKEQFSALYDLYFDWNSKINVISRKDIENLYLHHVLHSLGIAKMINFREGTTVMDFGCGGGFPGVPLAILFPNVKFHLVDSIGKKVRVAREKFNFVVSRAVMPLSDLMKICRKNINKQQHNALPNGIICLKGGDLQAEVQPFKNCVDMIDLHDYFKEEFFKGKKVVYVPVNQ